MIGLGTAGFDGACRHRSGRSRGCGRWICTASSSKGGQVMCCKAMNARYALFLVLLVAVPSIAEIQLRGAAGAYTKGLSRMRCSQLSLALRGGMPEQLWWQRPYKSNAERWAEAGVSLQVPSAPSAPIVSCFINASQTCLPLISCTDPLVRFD